ncbi:MAG: hypothetical protein JST08_10010 [Actinobacteria bacterium]|nr:hypothetical protein [Actinomycetota bacterium]
MSIRLSSKFWFGTIGAIALFLAALILWGSGNSDAASSKSNSDPLSRFSVLHPVGQAGDSVVTSPAAPSGLKIAAEAVLPGNTDAQPVSQLGVADMPSGKEMTVAALGRSICVTQEANAACDDAAQAASGELFGARPVACGSYWIFGVVPDGVTQVQIDQGSDGLADVSLPVVDNVYEGTIGAEASTAIGVDSSGAAQFKTAIPVDYYAETNEACN